MISRLFFYVFCVALIGTLGSVQADTVTLTDGKKLNGQIVDETDNEVMMEVQVSPSITDHKVISKDEIDTIEKEPPADKAFAELSQLKIKKDSYSVSVYEQAEKKLKVFLKQFPDASQKDEIKRQLKEITEEKQRVAAGDIKLDGKWFTKEEAEENKGEVYGKQSFLQMQSASARNDYVGAMNHFNTIETEYSGSTIFPDAVDAASSILKAFHTDLANKLRETKRWEEDWQKGYIISSEDQKIRLDAEKKRITDQNSLATERAKANNLKWLPVFDRDEESIVTAQKLTETELSRLSSIDVAKIRASITSANSALKALENNDFEKATTLANEAKSAWSSSVLAEKVLAEIPSRKAEKEAEQAAAEAASKETVEATPQPEVATTPQPATESPERTETPSPDTTSTPDSDTSEPTTETSFFMTPLGGVTVLGGVLVIVALLSILGKLKKSKAPATEENQSEG